MKDIFDMASTCIPGGYPQQLGSFQTPNHQIGRRSPSMGWQYPSVMQNHPTSLEDRNDSGINSGSDCHSSSPGSENSVERFSSPTSQPTEPTKLAYYPTPIYQRPAYHSSNVATPTMSPRRPVSPSRSPTTHIKLEPDNDNDNSSTNAIESRETPLKCLEMSVERNLGISASSPGISENSCDDDKQSEDVSEEHDENLVHVPRMNSHGKLKTFKCKQCHFVAITKFAFWAHQKDHIKPEKRLECTKCPFITEYKHHLEYHLRNHEGSKPFKCEHCDYSCVNKSMLNSHKKSHSNIYQYRCNDCHYVSKYCHSLKLHLRKYNHRPDMVLNPDGSPNPLPIIDVYGSRRGPKVKPIHPDQTHEQPRVKRIKSENSIPSGLPLQLQQLMAQSPAMPVPLAYTLPWLQQAMLIQNLERLAREESQRAEESAGAPDTNIVSPQAPATDNSGALDLTKSSDAKSDHDEDRPLKIETPSSSLDEEEDDDSTTMFENVEVVQNDEDNKEKTKSNETNNFTCQYCSISFGDAVLYTIHMGYHGYQDPFTCNMCGEKCNDKITFFLHMARTPHS